MGLLVEVKVKVWVKIKVEVSSMSCGIAGMIQWSLRWMFLQVGGKCVRPVPQTTWLAVPRSPDFDDIEAHRQGRFCQSTQVGGCGFSQPLLFGIVDCPCGMNGLSRPLTASLDFDKAEHPCRVAHHQV